MFLSGFMTISLIIGVYIPDLIAVTPIVPLAEIVNDGELILYEEE